MGTNLFVIDTNVLLSALLDNSSTSARAFNKARSEGALLVSEEIAVEYVRAFSREKFERYAPLKNRLSFIDQVIAISLPVAIKSRVVACRDPKDDKFLSLAINGHADCIISGDLDLLVLHPFNGIPILKPSEFLTYDDTKFSIRH